MRAVIIDDFGPTEQLHLASMPKPEPVEGEVQIATAYASVNPVDWKLYQGKLKHMLRDWAFPLIPGWDVSGIISAVGPEVEKFSVGDPVFACCKKTLCQWGAYADYVCCAESIVAHKPQSLSMAEAAATPLVALTAWQTLFDYCKLKKGDSVLIHAGAGGVGSLAIQLAHWKGARVYTTASAKNHDYVRALGADVAIDYTQEDFVERMKLEEPDGVDIVYDCVGGETLKRSYVLVKPGGYLPTIADAHDKERLKERGIHGICLIVRPNGEQLTEISQLLDAGTLKSPQVQEFSLDQVKEAHKMSQEGHVVGKIVLKVKDA